MDRARQIVDDLLETGAFDPRTWLTANDVESPDQVTARLVQHCGFTEGPAHPHMRYDTQYAAHKQYRTPVGVLNVVVHDYYDNDDPWIHVSVRDEDNRDATGAGYWNFKLPLDGSDLFKLVGWLDQKLTTLKDWQDIDNLRYEFRGQIGPA